MPDGQMNGKGKEYNNPSVFINYEGTNVQKASSTLFAMHFFVFWFGSKRINFEKTNKHNTLEGHLPIES